MASYHFVFPGIIYNLSITKYFVSRLESADETGAQNSTVSDGSTRTYRYDSTPAPRPGLAADFSPVASLVCTCSTSTTVPTHGWRVWPCPDLNRFRTTRQLVPVRSLPLEIASLYTGVGLAVPMEDSACPLIPHRSSGTAPTVIRSDYKSTLQPCDLQSRRGRIGAITNQSLLV